MLLETLKNSYKNTLIEPRLSGKFLSEKTLKEMTAKIDLATNLDEFIKSLPGTGERTSENACKHILERIIAWENEPPLK